MNFNNSNWPITGAFYTCTHKWAPDCVYWEACVTREKRSREGRQASACLMARVPCVGKIGDYLDVQAKFYGAQQTPLLYVFVDLKVLNVRLRAPNINCSALVYNFDVCRLLQLVSSTQTMI